MINENFNAEKDFYNKIGKKIGWDFSNIKCTTIDKSEFKYFDEINKNISEETILLDIGTGGGENLSSLISNDCILKIGTDFSKEMIKRARQNNKNIKIRFLEMNSNKIEFPNVFFDIITARHTPFNVSEVFRVLKKGGIFFSEQIDEEDCEELKEIFKRGQGFDASEKLIDKIKSEFNANKISDANFYNIIQKEYYNTEEDLLFLLNNTPIISSFGKIEKDYEKFNRYVNEFKTDRGILLVRRLFGIKVQK